MENKSRLKLEFHLYTRFWGMGLEKKYFTLNYEDYHCEKYGSNYYKLVDTSELEKFFRFLYEKMSPPTFEIFKYNYTPNIWLEVDGKKCRLLKGDIPNKDEMIKEKGFEVSDRVYDYLDKNLKDAKEKEDKKIVESFEYF